MSSLPSPPFITVPGVPNFRDLGGYPVSQRNPTHSIRRNFIYRCGETSRVTRDGIEILQSLGVNYVYDLRSSIEIKRNKSVGLGNTKEWYGCERIFVPVFEDKDYSPEILALRYRDYASEGTEGFTRAYSDILKSAATACRKILQHIADKCSRPFIIHCSAGKDRIGVICALILSVCGVPDDVVAFEYSLTEMGLSEYKEALVAHLTTNPALKDNRNGALNMISASPEQYLIEKCGLTPEEIQKIRSNLVIEANPIHDLPSSSA